MRCGQVEGSVGLEADATVRLTAETVTSTGDELTLWPGSIFDALRVGDRVGIDFHGAMLRVTAVGPGTADALVVAPGKIASNKAVTIDPPPVLPALSDKDLEAIGIGGRRGITHYALSFASRRRRRGEDPVAHAPGRAHHREDREPRGRAQHGRDHRGRGLDPRRPRRPSHEIALEYVPFYQKAIVRRANRGNRPVYVATNLLESMVTSTTPTIAEANDIANTLLDGVHGSSSRPRRRSASIPSARSTSSCGSSARSRRPLSSNCFIEDREAPGTLPRLEPA